MSGKIKAYDKISMDFQIDEIWQALIDIPSYRKWWPKVVKLEVSNFSKNIIGTEFIARPFGGLPFSCRIESINEKREILLNYFDGLYRGQGKWMLKENVNSTIVSYEVDLIIKNKFVNVISYLLPISKIHSLVFKKIFRGLQNYLSNRQH